MDIATVILVLRTLIAIATAIYLIVQVARLI
jgi:hypothetical protein